MLVITPSIFHKVFFYRETVKMRIALFAFVIALALQVEAEEKQLSDDEFTKKIEECQKQENATKTDAETIANHGIPETDGAKCIAACVLESTGVVGSAMNK